MAFLTVYQRWQWPNVSMLSLYHCMFERATGPHCNYTATPSNSRMTAFDQFNLTIRMHDVEKKYYADGEDAYMMKKELIPTAMVSMVKK